MKGERTRLAKYSAHWRGAGGFFVGTVAWAGFSSWFPASAFASASASASARALDASVPFFSISASGFVSVT